MLYVLSSTKIICVLINAHHGVVYDTWPHPSKGKCTNYVHVCTMALPGSRLERFNLLGLQEVGNQAGEGSYAVVVEFTYHGLKCAGKKLHRQLWNSNPEEREQLLRRFEDECEILSTTRHPNIVQFLGVGFERMSNTTVPILVMEFLETTLTACLRTNGILPVEISYSITSDVATALCYLQGQAIPIIHRDLTANNVLLTVDMRAKISDLGMAKILNLSAAERMQMTTCPGTQSYMPPEALSSGNAYYGCSIDIFAFGVLVHLFCGEWPLPGEANRVDSLDPNKLVPLTEAERRGKFFDILGSYHPLNGLIRQCLSNHPPYRPTADQVLSRVCQARAHVCPPAMNRLQMLAALERVTAETRQLSSKVQDSRSDQENLQESELQKLHLSLEELTVEKDSLGELLHLKEDILTARCKELKAMEQQVDAQRAEIVAQKKRNITKRSHHRSKGRHDQKIGPGKHLY